MSRNSARAVVVLISASALFAVGVCGGCSVADPTVVSRAASGVSTDQAVSDQLVQAVVNRLNIMPDVAYTKYVQKLPIDDPKREAELAASFVKQAVGRGVSAPFAEAVIKEQFTAAKQVQAQLMYEWTTGVRELPPYPPMDLAKDIRPQVDAATEALLNSLVACENERKQPGWQTSMDIAQQRAQSLLRPGVTNAELATALKYLRG